MRANTTKDDEAHQTQLELIARIPGIASYLATLDQILYPDLPLPAVGTRPGPQITSPADRHRHHGQSLSGLASRSAAGQINPSASNHAQMDRPMTVANAFPATSPTYRVESKVNLGRGSWESPPIISKSIQPYPPAEFLQSASGAGQVLTDNGGQRHSAYPLQLPVSSQDQSFLDGSDYYNHGINGNVSNHSARGFHANFGQVVGQYQSQVEVPLKFTDGLDQNSARKSIHRSKWRPPNLVQGESYPHVQVQNPLGELHKYSGSNGGVYSREKSLAQGRSASGSFGLIEGEHVHVPRSQVESNLYTHPTQFVPSTNFFDGRDAISYFTKKLGATGIPSTKLQEVTAPMINNQYGAGAIWSNQDVMAANVLAERGFDISAIRGGTAQFGDMSVMMNSPYAVGTTSSQGVQGVNQSQEMSTNRHNYGLFSATLIAKNKTGYGIFSDHNRECFKERLRKWYFKINPDGSNGELRKYVTAELVRAYKNLSPEEKNKWKKRAEVYNKRARQGQNPEEPNVNQPATPDSDDVEATRAKANDLPLLIDPHPKNHDASYPSAEIHGEAQNTVLFPSTLPSPQSPSGGSCLIPDARLLGQKAITLSANEEEQEGSPRTQSDNPLPGTVGPETLVPPIGLFLPSPLSLTSHCLQAAEQCRKETKEEGDDGKVKTRPASLTFDSIIFTPPQPTFYPLITSEPTSDCGRSDRKRRCDVVDDAEERKTRAKYNDQITLCNGLVSPLVSIGSSNTANAGKGRKRSREVEEEPEESKRTRSRSGEIETPFAPSLGLFQVAPREDEESTLLFPLSPVITDKYQFSEIELQEIFRGRW
ncbi:hypothetical protein HDU67_006918 [Dinochytrium kinnereticum]|nr:hypothetical protein HDU67_006918 [Dinochytrium kinnereticum]